MYSHQLDEENNQGLGIKIGMHTDARQSKMFDGYVMKGQTELEYNSTNFNFIDRFRYIEFDRD
jgi:hypothetical protein